MPILDKETLANLEMLTNSPKVQTLEHKFSSKLVWLSADS